MQLKSRLSRLKTQTGSPGTSPAPRPSLASLRQRIASLEARGRAAASRPGRTAASLPVGELAERVGGERLDDGLIRICKRLPLPACLPLHSSSRRKPGSMEFTTMDPGLRRDEVAESGQGEPRLPGETDDGRRSVYLDTETTGLAGGSGTLAFLIGIAVVEGGAIRLTQWLMPRFGAEHAALRALADTLSTGDRLVSYNGRSYDLPLLITRYRMQGLAHPFEGLPHLDLLHPVRRLFGRRWPDCRLTSLERRLLGITRVGDLPGSEAPEAWFDYVRHGHGGRLLQVVDHNRQDIVSLATAHRALAQVLEQPQDHDVDLHALARWRMEHSEDAARALLRSAMDQLCDDGRRLLARLERRRGNWPAAVALWEELAGRGCSDSLERLAKYHEHVSRDLAAARRCCQRLPKDPARDHRQRRLDRKLQQDRSG